VVNSEESLVAVHEKIDLITLGIQTQSLRNTEREQPDDWLIEKLEAMVTLAPALLKCILSLHALPYSYRLNVASCVYLKPQDEIRLDRIPFLASRQHSRPKNKRKVSAIGCGT